MAREPDPEFGTMFKASDEFATSYIEEMEIPDDADHPTVIFSMFIYTIHALLLYGWTKEQLIGEIHTHEAIASSDGPIQ